MKSGGGHTEMIMAALFILVVIVISGAVTSIIIRWYIHNVPQVTHILWARDVLADQPGPFDRRKGSHAIPKGFGRRLSEEDRDELFQVWQSIRTRFIDDPKLALVYADIVISDLIRKASQNTGTSLHNLDDSRIDETYRTAHEIVIRNKTGIVNPSELDQAMGLYMAVFDELFIGPEANKAAR
jgi:hypothetical protein